MKKIFDINRRNVNKVLTKKTYYVIYFKFSLFQKVG